MTKQSESRTGKDKSDMYTPPFQLSSFKNRISVHIILIFVSVDKILSVAIRITVEQFTYVCTKWFNCWSAGEILNCDLSNESYCAVLVKRSSWNTEVSRISTQSVGLLLLSCQLFFRPRYGVKVLNSLFTATRPPFFFR